LQQQATVWPAAVEAELTQRANAAMAVQATEIAESRAAAILSAYDYIEITREALSDQRLSSAELNAVAQTGANAVASLSAQGGAQLQGLADKVSQITTGVARGEIPQMGAQLQTLEGSLPARPMRP
jgi:hypothetical protein